MLKYYVLGGSMKYQLFSIRDNLSEEYAPPFMAKNESIAKRQYNNFIREQKLDKNDFGLYLLGEYDTDLGVIESELPILINDDVEVKLNGKHKHI